MMAVAVVRTRHYGADPIRMELGKWRRMQLSLFDNIAQRFTGCAFASCAWMALVKLSIKGLGTARDNW